MDNNTGHHYSCHGQPIQTHESHKDKSDTRLTQGEDIADCSALIVFLVSHFCCVPLPHDATGLSAVCDCGIF